MGKRCPNGSRKNKTGECILKSLIVKKRCPNGSRKKSKKGPCIKTNTTNQRKVKHRATATAAHARELAASKHRAEVEASADKARELQEAVLLERKAQEEAEAAKVALEKAAKAEKLAMERAEKKEADLQKALALEKKTQEEAAAAAAAVKEATKPKTFMPPPPTTETEPDIEKELVSTVLLNKKFKAYKEQNHIAAYKDNLKTAIVMVGSHGGYFIDEKHLPLQYFKAPIKVYLYRQAQPSCINIGGMYRYFRIYKKLQKVWNTFTQNQMKTVLNTEMCIGPTKYDQNFEDKYKINYQKHCFNNVNIRVYEQGANIADKYYTFKRHEGGLVKVVDAHDFFSNNNLLLDIKKNNSFFLSDVVEKARKHGMQEVHISDISCSLFLTDMKKVNGKIVHFKEIDGSYDYIKKWEDLQLGGR
jgi:hypothetical protein